MPTNYKAVRQAIAENRYLCTAAQRFPNGGNPNAMTFLRVIDRVGRTGSVQKNPKSSRNPPIVNEDMETDIVAMFYAHPHMGTRKAAAVCNVSQSSILRVLKKHGYHTYKCSLLQALYEGDEECRLNFADAMDQHKYRQILEDHVVDGFIDNLPLAQAQNVWYQHDGAGPHVRPPY